MKHAIVAASLQNTNEAGMRLKPEMTSRRLLVLAFVRDYMAQWGSSPSYGEIANGLGISHTRVRQQVKALVASGQLLRRPGPRGLHLPTLRDEAVRQLRDLGYVVDEDIFTVGIPCANSTLPVRPVLDYLPAQDAENSGQWEKQQGGARKSA